MKLRKIFDIICKEFPQIDFGIERETQTAITINAEINVKPYDDGVFVKIEANKDGFVDVSFIFDKLEKTLQNYELINDFNKYNNGYYGAYINDKGFFQIGAVFFDCDGEKDMAKRALKALYMLTNDSIVKRLLPITQCTK